MLEDPKVERHSVIWEEPLRLKHSELESGVEEDTGLESIYSGNIGNP